MNIKELAMSVDFNPARKQAVNLMLNESLVLQAKTYQIRAFARGKCAMHFETLALAECWGEYRASLGRRTTLRNVQVR